MLVSVIVPCHNEENYVGLLLHDLTEQTHRPDAVYVVDCQSEDKTVKIANRYAKELPLKTLQSPYRSAAAARNTGAAAAQTDFLLFLDADMRIGPHFIANLIHKATTDGVDFVTPRLRAEGHNPLDHLFAWSLNLWVYGYRMVISHKASGVAGGAMLIKRSAHEAIGGYDPKLREFDDIDYIHRMQKHHLSYAFAWQAAAVHSNRRIKEQGRMATALQAVPEHYFIARYVVRPLMRKLGIKPKWHDVL
jgi:glycosyltransferase involved in cell wall biosynthesis